MVSSQHLVIDCVTIHSPQLVVDSLLLPYHSLPTHKNETYTQKKTVKTIDSDERK